MSYGLLVGEIIRRVTGCSPGEYVRREIAGPLDADLFIGLPEDQESQAARHSAEPGRRTAQTRRQGSVCGAWLELDFAAPAPADINRRDIRAAELPSDNGIANARSMARVFAAMIGSVDGVRCLSSRGARLLSGSKLILRNRRVEGIPELKRRKSLDGVRRGREKIESNSEITWPSHFRY